MLEIAADHGVPVDLHTDETLDPTAGGLDVLAQGVLAGFPHGATASHCVSLGQQPLEVQRSTAERVAEAGISVSCSPTPTCSSRAAASADAARADRDRRLRAAGVNVAAGADNLQDPFNPVGRACPFETAGLMVMAAHDLPAGLAGGERRGSTVMGRRGRVRPGAPADLIAVRAATVREAIANGPAARQIWRRGVRIDEPD